MPDQSTPTIQQKGGLVGIGTGNPIYTLDVNGQARFLGNASTNSAAIFNNPSGGSGTAQFYAEFNAGTTVIARMLRGNGQSGLEGNGLNIDNFGGFQIRANQLGGSGGTIDLMGGFVGINELTPGYRLHVTDSSQYVAGFINNVANQLTTVTVQNSALSTAGVNTAAATFELVGKAGTSTHGRHAWIGAEGVASETFRTKVLFKVRGESNSGYTWSGAAEAPTIMTLDGNGLVGIGTTSPNTRLEIQDAALDYTSALFNAQIITTTPQSIDRGGSFAFGGQTGGGGFTQFGAIRGGKENSIFAETGGYLSFMTRANAGPITDKMRITSGGNVGIGTTSPTQTLDVNGTTLLRGNVYTQGEQGIELGWSGSTFNDQRIGRIRPISTPTQNPYAGGLAFDYYKYSGTQYQFYEGIRLTGSGNVGIGTTGPICILDVTDSGAVISGTATVGSNMKGIRIYNSTTATQNNAVGIWFSTGPHQAGIASFRANPATTWETSLAFYTHVDALSNLNDATEKMRLTGEGSLLVGGTSTVAGGVIQAQGTSTTTISIRTTVAGNGAPRLKFYHDGNDEFVIRGGDGVAFLTSGVNVRYSMNSSGQSSYNLPSGAGALGNGINIVTSPGTYTTGHGGILQFQNEDVITAGIRGVRASGWGSAMVFYVHNASAGNTFGTTFVERMRITETGDVGIGTNAPSTRFVVYDDTQDRFNIRISSTIANNNNKYMGIGFSGEESNTKGAIFFQSIGSSYSRGRMIFALNNVEDQSSATPSNAVLTLANNGAATFVSSVTATSFFESSDSRIKTLLDNNTNYSLVASIEARYYDKNGVQELGYFAQDFEQILPSAVQKDDEGFLNLSYTQVHTAKIAALEARVKELESQLKNK